MMRRVLFVVLVGISLVLAVTIHFHQAANAKLEQSLASLESLPKAELDRFRSDAKEFYQYNTKAARDERKRLRRLYNQIQIDPESEHLKKTMDQYVDWVVSFSDPPNIRVFQTRPINERVTFVHNSVMEMRRGTGSERPLSLEDLRSSIRETLPQELQSVVLSPLFDAFDGWLTKKYDDVKSTSKPAMNEEQLNCLSEFEEFYRDLFHRAGIETSPANHLGIPEKLAMIQLIQNLNSPPRMGGGGLRPGGWPRPGGGGPPVFRPGGEFMPESGGTRGDFLRMIDDAIEHQESNPFLGFFDTNKRLVLEKMDRPAARMEALQGLLALAVLERYPKVVDSWRFFQANSREEQDWIKPLGSYLFMMSSSRREEFLKLEPRYTTPRLQSELRGNVSPFFGLIFVRSNRDRPAPPNPGPPSPMPPPPRDDFPPDPNSGMPPQRPPDNRQGRNQTQQPP